VPHLPSLLPLPPRPGQPPPGLGTGGSAGWSCLQGGRLWGARWWRVYRGAGQGWPCRQSNPRSAESSCEGSCCGRASPDTSGAPHSRRSHPVLSAACAPGRQIAGHPGQTALAFRRTSLCTTTHRPGYACAASAGRVEPSGRLVICDQAARDAALARPRTASHLTELPGMRPPRSIRPCTIRSRPAAAAASSRHARQRLA